LVAERGRDFTAIRTLLVSAGLDAELDWVTTASAARARLDAHAHDLCVVVPRSGQRSVPEVLTWSELGPPVPMMVLTDGHDAAHEDALMSAGAAEVLDREADAPEEIGRAVRRLLHRESRVRRLRERAERLGTMVDLTPAGVVHVALDGRVTAANGRATRWLGRGAPSLAGRRLDELLGEEYVRVETYVDAALGGRGAGFETELRFGGDGLRRVGVRLIPDVDVRNHARGFVMIVEDAQRAKGEAILSGGAEDRLRDFALGAVEWLWETDAEQRLVYVSEGVERHAGRSADRMLGRTLWNALDAEDDAETEELVSAMGAGRAVADTIITGRDERGTPHATLVTARPLQGPNGTFRGYRGLGRDVTAETRAVAQEFEAIDRLAGPAVASLTRQAFGQGGLDEAMPEVFAELVAEYGAELERIASVPEERAVFVTTPAMQDLAQRLGFLRASARDVVRLHRAALAQKLRLAAPEPTRRMLAIGRLVLVGALTLLIGHFRASASAERPIDRDVPLLQIKR
jgi:PAS domain S-box-containing protein